MLAGFLLANLVIVAVAATILLTRPPAPPLIQGVLLTDPRPLPPFQLIDHHNRVFGNDDLKGSWHLVSYGFTTCPDVCPTTLAQLDRVTRELQAMHADAPGVLFYSVDHRRDTVSQMASYVPYFNPAFVGLTHGDDPANPHLPFEQGLGIAAQLVPDTGEGADPDANNYQVNHGVTLFLLNPAGELQAIFEPEDRRGGVPAFNPDTIVRDYLAIRDYLG